MTRMPAAFFGHGSPMNALDHNRYTEAWRAFGAAVPRPRAVLVVSAHWYSNATAVTAMATPRTIHDFYGFPDELFGVRYPAPGDPGLAEEVADVVKPMWVGRDRDSWGIDHGTWSVLVHAFPDAPTPDHFIPLLYLAGLAVASGETVDVLVDGYAMGSLSMISYTLGCEQLAPDGQGGAPALPEMPADETDL